MIGQQNCRTVGFNSARDKLTDCFIVLDFEELQRRLSTSPYQRQAHGSVGDIQVFVKEFTGRTGKTQRRKIVRMSHKKRAQARHHEFPEIDRNSQQAASLKRTQTVVRHLGARTRVIQIDPQEDVEEIESQIAAKTKIAQDKFYLICMGRVLQPGACPADYGISRDSTLIMTGRLLCSRT
jgi:hypothetical protein